MHLDETPGHRLRRLQQQIERLRHDAAIWQTRGSRETAQELRVLANVLRTTVEALARVERVLEKVQARPTRRDVPTLFDP